MGIEWHTTRFLIASAKAGVSFQRSLTLGHQNLHVPVGEVQDLFAESGGAVPPDTDAVLGAGLPYADGVLKLLGATDLVTLDASSYEGASVIHDMNAPLATGTPAAQALRGGFDAVFDGGTLEHVFNFPTAVKNAMEMVKVGGHLLLQTPANNYFGHGFYQFSPELFFRVLSPDNGFLVERMVAFECFPGSQWYEVADPATLRSRVQLIGSAHRILLLVRARRTHEADIFRAVPQQSDYANAWRDHAAECPAPTPLTSPRVTKPKRHRAAAAAFPRRFVASIRRRTSAAIAGFGPKMSRLMQAREVARDNRRLALDAQPAAFRPVDE